MKPVRDAIFHDESNPPIASYIQRWPEALPLFDVGHLKHLGSFEKGKIEEPGKTIVFAGDYLGGPFMEGAFTSGLRAAERLHVRTTRALPDSN
ncbi:MAG TPA: FAD-dependent oxidoreductase [Candidatus Saccharimonadales bacterium]|nr:FAD-dependent oxidoreductase [Candidatus Saccharimonadales bacterium]